jgi:hypothetical protein
MSMLKNYIVFLSSRLFIINKIDSEFILFNSNLNLIKLYIKTNK